MSAIGYDTAYGSRRIGSNRLDRRRMMRALRRLDRSERYSPVLCVAMLLIIGLVVKSSPAIHHTPDVDFDKIAFENSLSKRTPPGAK